MGIGRERVGIGRYYWCVLVVDEKVAILPVSGPSSQWSLETHSTVYVHVLEMSLLSHWLCSTHTLHRIPAHM